MPGSTPDLKYCRQAPEHKECLWKSAVSENLIRFRKTLQHNIYLALARPKVSASGLAFSECLMNDARYARLVEIHRVRKLSTAKAQSDPITGYLQVINRKPLALCKYRHEQVGENGRATRGVPKTKLEGAEPGQAGRRPWKWPRPGPFR